MKPVTIGVDARTFYNLESMARGIGHYSRYHLQALAALMPDWHFRLFADDCTIPEPLNALAQAPNVTLAPVDEFDPGGIDLLHICDPMNFQLGFDSPMRIFKGAARCTVTFYDLIPLQLYFSSWREAQRRHYRLRLEQFLRSPATFLAISAHTASDLIRLAGVDPRRVEVILAGLNNGDRPELSGQPPASGATLARYGLRKPFFLHVGALDPHKNFETSLAAFKTCRRSVEAQLVVVGQKDDRLSRYAQQCAALGMDEVVFTGYLPREALTVLYREAAALLFMSRYEGFGFPVLEAMSRGCPVIASNVSSIPEVAGDAAILLDPEDGPGVCRAMLGLIQEPKRVEALRRKGIQQAEKFTWERTARKTLDIWQKMLSESGERRNGSSRDRATAAVLDSGGQNPLRVLLDISVLGLSVLYDSSRTGVFRVVENLAKGLSRSAGIELSFCATQPRTENAPETLKACRQYLASCPELGRVPFFPQALPPADVFHSPFHALPSGTEHYQRFLTVHDLIPWLHPELFKGKAANPVRHLFHGLGPEDMFFCTSKAAQADLCRHLGLDAARVHLAPLAADSALFRPCRGPQERSGALRRYGIPEGDPYFLSLCTLEPRKNLEGVLRAFAAMLAGGRIPEARLVLAGTPGWNVAEVLRVLDEQPALRERVIATGFVADEDLAALYGGALAFVYMSHYEGFGLPPLEAMQCGCPVIVADNSALPEVVGEAGILLDARDVKGLALAMNEVAVNSELRAEMARRGLRQASHFSWGRFIAETLAAYRAAVTPRRTIRDLSIRPAA